MNISKAIMLLLSLGIFSTLLTLSHCKWFLPGSSCGISNPYQFNRHHEQGQSCSFVNDETNLPVMPGIYCILKKENVPFCFMPVLKSNGNWTNCDKSCNGGTKHSLATCFNSINGQQIDDDICGLATNHQVTMNCNSQPCSSNIILCLHSTYHNSNSLASLEWVGGLHGLRITKENKKVSKCGYIRRHWHKVLFSCISRWQFKRRD